MQRSACGDKGEDDGNAAELCYRLARPAVAARLKHPAAVAREHDHERRERAAQGRAQAGNGEISHHTIAALALGSSAFCSAATAAMICSSECRGENPNHSFALLMLGMRRSMSSNPSP